MRIEKQRLPGGGIADCLAFDFPRVSDFFRFDPGDPGAWPDRYQYLQTSYRQDRERLAVALTAYNRRLGCTQATLASIDRLRDPSVTAVVTGQQAGILTGPLYTVYKALTAIVMAAKAERDYGIPAVPVFWVASEDHDYAEINHIRLLKETDQLETLALPGVPAGHRSVGDLPLGSAVTKLLDDLEWMTPDSEAKAGLMAMLRDTAAWAANLADWCNMLMTRLLGQFGLICFDPMEPALRQMMAPVFRQALTITDGVNQAVLNAAESLKQQGFAPQLEFTPSQANLFIYAGGERLPLEMDGKGFTVRGRPELSYTREQLLELAESHPERFSPNVALRPVTQDEVLPTLAYVGGPGEIAYYAQLAEVYPQFGKVMPIIYPRLSLTLLDAATAAGLDRFGLTLADAARGGTDQLDAYLESIDPVGVDRLFAGIKTDFSEAYAQLGERLAAIDDSLPVLSQGNLGRILFQVGYLEQKARQHHRRRHKALGQEYRAVSREVYPGGEPQERVLNIFPFLFRYGPDLLDRLAERLNLDGFEHILVRMEEDTHGAS